MPIDTLPSWQNRHSSTNQNAPIAFLGHYVHQDIPMFTELIGREQLHQIISPLFLGVYVFYHPFYILTRYPTEVESFVYMLGPP